MDALNIQTVSMSRAIHVDASLVSKWKTGDRNLSLKSGYFEDIIDFIMQESTNTIHQTLKNLLTDLYPHEKIDDETQIERLLRQLLINSNTNTTQLVPNNKNSISTIVFKENSGHRNAISKILNYAESMEVPGEMLFIDNEDFHWLLEDNEYVKIFITRVEKLIHKGFHATFIINYSAYKNQLIKFFDVCSPLIFHRNVDWYYNEYYDKTLLNFSFFIINHAISLLGISSNSTSTSTMIFTDINTIMQHELITSNIRESCKPIFSYFKVSNIFNVLSNVSKYRKKGTLYSYLPAPVFLFSTEEELRDILKNQVDEDTIAKCLELNYKLRKIADPLYFNSTENTDDSFIYIFKYEELLHRASQYTFVSDSLSHICNKEITITAKQYAARLRNLADSLIHYNNIKIVLASDRDGVSLPTINCWCKKDIFMIQMNKDGLRISSEYSILNAVSTKWERCIRTVPSKRKEMNSVNQFLLELADNCEYIKPTI